MMNQISSPHSKSSPTPRTCLTHSKSPPQPPPGRPTVSNLISQLEFSIAHRKKQYIPKKGIKIALFVEYDKHQNSTRVAFGKRVQPTSATKPLHKKQRHFGLSTIFQKQNQQQQHPTSNKKTSSSTVNASNASNNLSSPPVMEVTVRRMNRDILNLTKK